VRTDRLQREYGIKLRWTVFPLHPEIPEQGMEIAELFPGREAQISEMQERLSKYAAVERLPLMERQTRTYNSRLAQELGKWAESQGAGEAFHREVYRTFFVEDGNIALVDELMRITQKVGLPTDEAREVLAAHSFAAAVDADWQRAGELRITAVPTHLCDGRRLEGFRPYDDFVWLINQG